MPASVVRNTQAAPKPRFRGRLHQAALFVVIPACVILLVVPARSAVT
jgi:hypothetical protein